MVFKSAEIKKADLESRLQPFLTILNYYALNTLQTSCQKSPQYPQMQNSSSCLANWVDTFADDHASFR